MRAHSDSSPAAIHFAADGPSANEPLPVLFDTPGFALTDQDGHPFDAAKLRGHVWVADFIFTHCATFCPIMTSAMAEFQRASAAAGMNDVRMASFTVDPDRDTPAVLKEYARINGADGSRWTFLTGTKKQLWDLSTGMELSVGPGDESLGGSAGMQVMHSSRFLLVDRNGHVRGVYDFKNAAYLKQLLADAKRLSAE
jgi:protein SCO1/2